MFVTFETEADQRDVFRALLSSEARDEPLSIRWTDLGDSIRVSGCVSVSISVSIIASVSASVSWCCGDKE